MKKKLLRKLKGTAGETIVEILVALLISSFALMMLSGLISTTKKLIKNSEAKMTAYYTQSYKRLAEKKTGSGKAGTLTLKVKISEEDQRTVKIGDKESLDVTYYVNDGTSSERVGTVDVISYKKAEGSVP